MKKVNRYEQGREKVIVRGTQTILAQYSHSYFIHQILHVKLRLTDLQGHVAYLFQISNCACTTAPKKGID